MNVILCRRAKAVTVTPVGRKGKRRPPVGFRGNEGKKAQTTGC
jgi:hypothetical protein